MPGVNPESAAAALHKAAEKRDLTLKIATITGGDMMAGADDMQARGIREMSRGTAVPDDLISMNAYFGALPIADALDARSDVAVTGRVVDSALVLSPLIHEFDWRPEDLDLLAQGSLAALRTALGQLPDPVHDQDRWQLRGGDSAPCGPVHH